jgi:WbqC-like protein family
MSKSIAIMQPYFFPYIGYFQLICSVDEFVIYDNIKYTKKGWINRNRLLINGKDAIFSLPLKNDSDDLNVVDRKISDLWSVEKEKLFNRIYQAYHKALYFKKTYQLLQDCLSFSECNLFLFILSTLLKANTYLEISTPIIVSSTVNIDHNLKSEDKVLAIAKQQNATTYVNAIGGIELYDKKIFKENGINLQFIKSNPIVYKQFEYEFIPCLSIIDVMMHNSKKQIQEYLKSYTLI